METVGFVGWVMLNLAVEVGRAFSVRLRDFRVALLACKCSLRIPLCPVHNLHQTRGHGSHQPVREI